VTSEFVDDLPGAVPQPVDQFSANVVIDAPPEKVWALVTAMDRYGEWSNENAGGYWRKGPDGQPGTGRVGDQFVGVNRRDGQEWKALVEIVRRDEQREFAFVTGGLEHNVALWCYRLEPEGGGTRLTESWALRQLAPNMIEKGQAKIDYRWANARDSIRATLAAMKATAERA
jgi:uncharacterized protein YndB with AHSA1/START domain